MNLIQLSRLIQSEQACEDYLKSVGILKTFTECPKCKATRIGRVRRNRYKCYECKYEWNIRKGSVLEGMILESSKFIACVKMFDYGLSPSQCSQEISIAYETASAIYRLIRNRIALISDPLDEGLPSYNSKCGKIPIIILKSIQNRIKVSLIDNNKISEEDYGIIYFERSKNDMNQISFSCDFEHHSISKESNLQQFNIIDRFWRYATNKLSYNKISDINDLYLYFKELELRFNTRDQKLFIKLANLLVAHSLVA